MVETYEEYVVSRVVFYLDMIDRAHNRIDIYKQRKTFHNPTGVKKLQEQIDSYEELLLNFEERYPNEYIMGKMKYGC